MKDADLRGLVEQERATQGLPSRICDAVALVRLAERMKDAAVEPTSVRERTGSKVGRGPTDPLQPEPQRIPSLVGDCTAHRAEAGEELSR